MPMCTVYACVLMPNHFDLLLETGKSPLSKTNAKPDAERR
jgi:hypothetical protein